MDRPTIVLSLFIIVFCGFQCFNCWLEAQQTTIDSDDEEDIVEIVDAVPMTPRSAEEVHVKIKLKTSDMVYG
jgi:hypothetical protein